MSEIKDVNKLVIKNSATIELERRKGFVNILLQGNPNLYRAWVERNNKIVIDISGESTEYNLDTETPDYIEIVKNQSDNKYYINFVGSITGDGNLVSDDITFSQEGDNTKLTIKSSKFVSTSKIQSGTPDYLYVNVNENGNVSIGVKQELLTKLELFNDIILPNAMKAIITYDSEDSTYNSIQFEMTKPNGTTEIVNTNVLYNYLTQNNGSVSVVFNQKVGTIVTTTYFDSIICAREAGGAKYIAIYFIDDSNDGGYILWKVSYNTLNNTLNIENEEINNLYVNLLVSYDEDDSSYNSIQFQLVTKEGSRTINKSNFYKYAIVNNVPVKVTLSERYLNIVNTEQIDSIVRYQEVGGIKYYTIFCISSVTNGFKIYGFTFNGSTDTIDFTSKSIV